MSDDQTTFDRRAQHELRTIFPAACEALRPFFDPANHWAGQAHELLALRTLKEEFPTLTAQESFIVVSTAKRLFAARHTALAPTTKS